MKHSWPRGANSARPEAVSTGMSIPEPPAAKRPLAVYARRRGVALAAIAAAAALCGLALTFQVVRVASASMSPTLLPGDLVLVSRLLYVLHPPRRGDLIVLRFPQAEGREFVKRVVGLPGDVVEERGGRFLVNGVAARLAHEESSEDAGGAERALGPSRVSAHRLYVLGDNRGTSLDSRFWGTVYEHDVVGQAVLVCWSRGEYWWQVRWDRIGRWLA